jgi:hypothetical protein
VLATLKELQLATLNALHLFGPCSARVSASVMVLSDSPCEIIGKWETFPIFNEDKSKVSV